MGCTSSDAGTVNQPGKGAKNELIEVTYFNIGHGRADPIKQMLAHANANWKFHGETFETWGARKSSGKTAEFGALPIIKQGDKTYDLSIPSMRVLAMQLGYYPGDDWKKAAIVDMISETYSDVFNLWSGTLISEDKTNAEKAKVF